MFVGRKCCGSSGGAHFECRAETADSIVAFASARRFGWILYPQSHRIWRSYMPNNCHRDKYEEFGIWIPLGKAALWQLCCPYSICRFGRLDGLDWKFACRCMAIHPCWGRRIQGVRDVAVQKHIDLGKSLHLWQFT